MLPACAAQDELDSFQFPIVGWNNPTRSPPHGATMMHFSQSRSTSPLPFPCASVSFRGQIYKALLLMKDLVAALIFVAFVYFVDTPSN